MKVVCRCFETYVLTTSETRIRVFVACDVSLGRVWVVVVWFVRSFVRFGLCAFVFVGLVCFVLLCLSVCLFRCVFVCVIVSVVGVWCVKVRVGVFRVRGAVECGLYIEVEYVSVSTRPRVSAKHPRVSTPRCCCRHTRERSERTHWTRTNTARHPGVVPRLTLGCSHCG